MLILETDYCNFGSFKDLEIFMRHEKIDKIKVTTKYIGDVINIQILTYSEVLQIIK